MPADQVVPLGSLSTRDGAAIGTAGFAEGMSVRALIDWGIAPEDGPIVVTGAIDCVGGATLADVLSTMAHGGAVAASGLTGGPTLNTTVMPFILRGVALTRDGFGVDAHRTAP